uniref:Piwi-like protein 1 n=1 Tax=Sphaeramia orbicularis TaxID=375764 RepID=A0A673CUZ6_9TELE
MEHVKESKSGTSGSMIVLTSNYFRILSRPQWVLYQYHVDFQPPMESRRLRTALLYQHDQLLGKAQSFDGALLFLPHRLHSKETVLHSETKNGEKVQITVTLTNELPPTSPVCIQFYNIIFRRLVLGILNMQQIGRNYYNPNDPLNIPQHRLIIWPGYATAILQYESSILLSIDVSHKVLRSETVLDFMYSLRQQCGSQRFSEICAKELIGLIVLTKYNNKTYRIDDIAWDQTPTNTFKRGDTEISFKNYYRTVGFTCLVQVGKWKPLDLDEYTKLNPEQREGRLKRFISNIQKNTDAQAELDNWGLAFDKQLLSLKARVLPAEKIVQGSNSYSAWKADWTKEMRGLPLMRSPPLNNWMLFHTRHAGNAVQSLLQCIERVSGPFGVRCRRPVMIEYSDQMEALLRALQQNVGPQTQMVVVVLPNNRKDKYDCVKKYLCVDCPVPSQCIVLRTISNNKTIMTVATKIVLQMACKMGGELWSVEIPLKQLMIVGIDCYHDTTAGRRSIGALVASLNQTMSRWYSQCVLQHKGQEIMDGLKGALSGALKTYLKFNNCLPSRIIVYRDGVGDGQLHSVVNYEVSQIMESIKPKLSVVVVKKRINTRFFYRGNGKVSNPPPGTVVDTDVTRPEWYDFYIVSQAVQTGSVSPTHYNVVFDISGLKPDHMQRLTYKMCHLYYNWQGIIRVPAPCQYAHKLAFLVGQSIHRDPSVQLGDLLFYL